MTSSQDSGTPSYFKNRITAIVLLAFTGFMWHSTADIPEHSQLFPRMILGALGILSTLMLVRTYLPSLRFNDKSEPFFVNPRILLFMVLSVIAYVLAVQWLGYFTASVFFIPAIAYALGQRGTTMIGVSTALFLLVVYLVFIVVFDRPLPVEFWAVNN